MSFRWIASALLLASALPAPAQTPLTLAEALRLAERRAPAYEMRLRRFMHLERWRAK